MKRNEALSVTSDSGQFKCDWFSGIISLQGIVLESEHVWSLKAEDSEVIDNSWFL